MSFQLDIEDRPGPDPDGRLPDARAYQDRADGRMRDAYRAGERRLMLCSPTGSGKTYIGLRIIHGAIQRGRRALFVCDREALIDQTSRQADAWGIDHGVIQGKHWRRNPGKPFQIASAQTIEKRGYWPAANVIVIDEAHTIRSAVVEHIKSTEALVIGLSATPFTKGLGLIYPHLENVATMHELIEVEKPQALVPIELHVCESPDMAAVTPGSDGEWTADAAADAELKIVGNVVADSIKLGAGQLKAIVFGPKTEYCEELERQYIAAGVPARCYTYKTEGRAEILKAFHRGEIRVLISVDALAKGFDAPDVEMVIDAYPMRKSLSTIIQRWGRGLRICPSIGKTRCLILDFAGNARRFWYDLMRFYHHGCANLDAGEKLDATVRKGEEDFEPAGCPKCHFKPFLRHCMKCGYERQSVAIQTPEPGVMRRVMIGKNVAAESPHDLFRQIVEYTRRKVSGDKEKYARCRYKDIVGEWPPRSWVFDQTEGAPVSQATLGKLKSLQIRFAKSRGKSPPKIGSRAYSQGELKDL